MFTVKCVYCENSWKLQTVGQGAGEQQLVAWMYSGSPDSSGSRRTLEHRGHITWGGGTVLAEGTTILWPSWAQKTSCTSHRVLFPCQ